MRRGSCRIDPALLVCLGLGACGSGTGAVGPADEQGPAALRTRALAAGLAPLPPEPPRPVDNPFSPPRVELGRLLFFDPILSGPKDVACSTCHLPRFAFADGRQFPSGAGGAGLGPERTVPSPPPLRPMPRNSPALLNVGLYGRGGTTPSVNGTLFWGGGAFGLEDQALNPITADNELRGLAYPKVVALDSVMERLRGVEEYLDRFATAFPDVVSTHGRDPRRLVTTLTLRRALAAYVRELVTPASPYDRFLRGEDDALTPLQRQGLGLFIGEAGCVDCHGGPVLSDFTMRVLGTGQAGLGRDTTPGDDLGWGEHGGVPYAFRTPPLRQVELTAPYFHAGTETSLMDVLRFKNEGRSGHAAVRDTDLDPAVRPLGLTEAQLGALAAFLASLTDRRTAVDDPLFQPPGAVPSGLEVPR